MEKVSVSSGADSQNITKLGTNSSKSIEMVARESHIFVLNLPTNTNTVAFYSIERGLVPLSCFNVINKGNRVAKIAKKKKEI